MMRLVVYDLDGTLIDTSQALANATEVFVAAQSDPVRAPIAEALFAEAYEAAMADGVQLMLGARELLAHFRNRHQMILTDRPESIAWDVLNAAGIRSEIAAVMGGDSPHGRKPDPAGLRALMRAAGVTPEKTLFIGDRDTDVETGRRAGVMTVHISATESAAELRVPDLRACRELAQQRGL